MYSEEEKISMELREAQREAEILEQVNARVRRKTSWILLFISFMCLVLVTFAWFTISTLANVEKLEMKIGTAPDLRISTENHGSNFDAYVKTVTSRMIDKESSPVFTDVDFYESREKISDLRKKSLLLLNNSLK